MSRTNITGIWSETYYYLEDDVTLVTQGDANKIDRIIELAKHWDGPMSIAVFVSNDNIVFLTTKIGANDNIMRRKNIDFHLVAASGEFYPVNVLRNLALTNARTDFVLLLDVDFLPSYGLHSHIKSILARGALQGNEVLVVPAFEYPTETQVQELPKDKKTLVNQMEQGYIEPFHWKWFPTMGPVDFQRWVQETKPYTVKYKDGFEPYIVMERSKVPVYDQNFMGRFGDKNSHLMEVWARGFEFVVLPDCFLVHYPHFIGHNFPYHPCAEQIKQKFVDRLKIKYNIADIP